jgi:hypothetical protein
MGQKGATPVPSFLGNLVRVILSSFAPIQKPPVRGVPLTISVCPLSCFSAQDVFMKIQGNADRQFCFCAGGQLALMPRSLRDCSL